MKIFNKSMLKSGLKQVLVGIGLLLGVTSCTSDPNSPGVEYMPDMYRPQPYEAYLEKHDGDSAKFFDRNIKKIAPNFDDLSAEQQSVVINEVASIYAVWTNGSASRKPVKGSVAIGKKPYALSKGQKEESKLLVNPVSFTKSNLKEGKAYFEIFCDHCHGVKGDGNGPMIQLDVFPAQPPSFTGAAKDLTAGEIYHTIYYGKGKMGSHASQISEDKRWKIVMYVESLQGKIGKESEMENLSSDSTVVAQPDSI
jgi:mono/diheme cytochrome c family protein